MKWKQLEKKSIILYPGANSRLRESKKGNTLLNLLSMSTTRPFIILHWCFVSEPREKQWGLLMMLGLDSSNNQRM